MKALITKASDCDYEEIREFDSLEQLLQFAEENGGDLIISTKSESYALDLTIYDWMDEEAIQRVKEKIKKYGGVEMEVKIYDFWVE